MIHTYSGYVCLSRYQNRYTKSANVVTTTAATEHDREKKKQKKKNKTERSVCVCVWLLCARMRDELFVCRCVMTLVECGLYKLACKYEALYRTIFFFCIVVFFIFFVVGLSLSFLFCAFNVRRRAVNL